MTPDLSLSLVTHLLAIFGVGFGLGAIFGGILSSLTSLGDALKTF